ncbi:restriction endonuclease [Nitrospirillum sp. BR 11828]|uniref:restriction endonuclease n=1 Tax=Nitrospirillum sp. BR 11828 TaxID=3104325 RepID=UPI002ACADAB7|nr:restriction endonuclease [Nitrospirillum sp. BR 11828]MDZ5647854.1 restriction endonuclease [Nitrospirillum sp. BR 11828]
MTASPKHSELPKYTDFFKPTLEALRDLGGSGSVEEIEDALVSSMKIPAELLNVTYSKSGAPILPDRMSWARSFLKIPGFITNPRRGVWILTEEGRTAAERPSADLRRIVADAYNASLAAKKAVESENDIALVDRGEEVDDWTSRLLQRLMTMSPSAFEQLCKRILRESGFTRVEVTGKTNDGGIDGVGVLRINLVSFHVLFQCKRWKNAVGSEVVRNFRGAMQGRADKGLIITTGTFTAEGRREATRDGAPAIDLIDGETLCGLLKDLRLGVSVREVIVEEITINNEFFDQF